MTMSITIDQTHIDRVLTTLQQEGTCYRLEAVERLCPDLTLDQVFLAIDYLTRTGQVCLTLDTDRTYWVKAARAVTDEYSFGPSAGSQNVKPVPSIS